VDYKKLDRNDIDFLINITSKDRVLYGQDMDDDYSHDEMPVYGKYIPEAVVKTVDVTEVSAVMNYADKNNIPVTPRGAGTGLCGGAVPVHGGIVLSLTGMDRILEIDENNLTITVEPGVLLSDLKKTLAEKGLMYPPDPGEKGASVGGNAMTNAGGMRALKYGVTRDYVRGMEVVLASGDVIEVGGKVAKNSSGYSLKDIFVGSEGTLGIVTKLILKIVPAPGSIVSLLVPFGDVDSCISAVPDILRYRTLPTAVEFMQKEVIEAAEIFLGRKFPHDASEAYLLLMYDGVLPEDLEKTYMDAAQICMEKGAEDVFVADTEKKNEAIWSIRDVFLEAIKSTAVEMDECDVVVPVSELAVFIKSIGAIKAKYDIRILCFGHAGDGNVHVYVCRDRLSDADWKERLKHVMKEMYDKAIVLKGQVSGEHGIGHAKIEYLKESSGAVKIQIMKDIKAVFDPKNILNPGKIVDALHAVQHQNA
jgi:glycolate oxidase